MQTFLPSKDYEESAYYLDSKRLNKQAIEGLQILYSLTLPNYGWKTHPAVKMWKGYEQSLAYYVNCISDECFERNIKCEVMNVVGKMILIDNGDPHWLGDERLHSSHRAALLKKDIVHYGQYGWTEEPRKDYWWPL